MWDRQASLSFMSICDISVNIAARLRTERPMNRCSISGRGVRFLYMSRAPIPAFRPSQSSNQRISGDFSPEIMRSGREAGHLRPYAGEVKNTWNYTATPPYIFRASSLINPLKNKREREKEKKKGGWCSESHYSCYNREGEGLKCFLLRRSFR